MNASCDDYFYNMATDHLVCKEALLLDQQGDWEGAHHLIDHLASREAAWVHAYLHRKEGDQWNADYWYRRAQKPRFEGSLQEEWEKLWLEFGSH